MTDQFRQPGLIRSLRSTVNVHAAAGLIDGDEVLGALLYVVAHFIGRVRDPTKRKAYIEEVFRTLPTAVAFEAGQINAIDPVETMQ